MVEVGDVCIGFSDAYAVRGISASAHVCVCVCVQSFISTISTQSCRGAVDRYHSLHDENSDSLVVISRKDSFLVTPMVHPAAVFLLSLWLSWYSPQTLSN